MDIKTLKVFLMVANTKHFAKAAEALHSSPSTVSRSISKLEESLNVRVFERDNRHVKLTWQGEQLKLTAQSILEQWRKFQQQMDNEQGLHGKVNLYCSVTASYSLMPNLMRQIRMRFPGIEVHLSTGDAANAIKQVQQNKSDLCIAPKPNKLADDLVFKAFSKTPLVFIRPLSKVMELPLGQNNNIDWGLVNFVLAEQGIVRDEFDAWAKQQVINVTEYASVSGHEAIISMVALGYGVALVPLLVLEHSPLQTEVEVLEVDNMNASFDVGFCCKRAKLNESIVSAIWNLDFNE